MLNGTRGAMVAMLATLMPMLLIAIGGSACGCSCGIVASVALAAAAYVPAARSRTRESGRASFDSIEQGNIESSVGVRLKIWHVGMQYFANHPWTGVGVGQFARILATPFCNKQPKSLSCIAEHAHNDIVEAAPPPVLGLLTMLGLFLVPAELFRRALIACRGSHHQR
jgi:O-antigen ligase